MHAKIKNTYKNLSDLILCVDIGIDSNTDLTKWVRVNSPIFRLDILNARAIAIDSIFLHLEKGDRRTVFYKTNDIIFIIIAKETVQFQLLEAILDTIMKEFFNIYEDILDGFLSGMTNRFLEFNSLIPNLILKARDENIKWIEAFCKVCKKNHMIVVKKSLINDATRYPVSLVFKHLGHGLLIYIDSHFKVRGEEIVEITG